LVLSLRSPTWSYNKAVIVGLRKLSTNLRKCALDKEDSALSKCHSGQIYFKNPIGTTPNPLIESLPLPKVRVFFEWNRGMLFPTDIAYFGLSRTKWK
jgi:hypothetical protein